MNFDDFMKWSMDTMPTFFDDVKIDPKILNGLIIKAQSELELEMAQSEFQSTTARFRGKPTLKKARTEFWSDKTDFQSTAARFRTKFKLEEKMLELYPFYVHLSKFFEKDPNDISEQEFHFEFEKLEKLKESHPKVPDALTRCKTLASFHRHLGSPREAERIVAEINNEHPEDTTGWMMMGALIWGRGDLIESEKVLRKAVELDPKDDFLKRFYVHVMVRAKFPL